MFDAIDSEWIARAQRAPADANLLKCLIHELPANSTCRASLVDAIELGCRFSIANSRQQKLVGERFVWYSRQRRFSQRLAVLSSRLGRKLDQCEDWFDALRTFIARSSPRRDLFLTATDVSADRFVRRCAELYGRSSVCVEVAHNVSIVDWLCTQFDRSNGNTEYVSFSPILNDERDRSAGAGVAEPISKLPIRDRSLVAAADQVIVLHLRSGGNIDRLIEHVLSDNDPPTIRVLANSKLVPERTFRKLLSQGGIGWYLWAPQENERGNTECDVSLSAPIIEMPNTPSRFLTHWTRRQAGAWLDQPDEEFLNELILGEASKNRSAFAALARIVTSTMLGPVVRSEIGTAIDECRSAPSAPVVSFTEVPLDEWDERRVFRKHRNRWDFEPYGIAIDRDWLTRQGAKRVIYGTAAERDALPCDLRPYFQSEKSIGPATGDVIDWSEEREWRHVGSIDLSALPAELAFVFVPTRGEAEHLAKLSKWPVAVLHLQESP